MRVQRAFHPTRNIHDTCRTRKTVYAKRKVIILTFDFYQDVHCKYKISSLTFFLVTSRAGFRRSVFILIWGPLTVWMHSCPSAWFSTFRFFTKTTNCICTRRQRTLGIRTLKAYVTIHSSVKMYTFKKRGTCAIHDTEGVGIYTKRFLGTKAPTHTHKEVNSLQTIPRRSTILKDSHARFVCFLLFFVQVASEIYGANLYALTSHFLHISFFFALRCFCFVRPRLSVNLMAPDTCQNLARQTFIIP